MVAASLSAQPYTPAHVISGTSNPCQFFLACPTELLEWWAARGDYDRVEDTDVEVIAPAPGGQLYGVLHSTGQAVRVQPLDVRTPLNTAIPGANAVDIVVAASGAFYVLAMHGSSPVLYAFEPNGSLRASWPVSATTANATVDLAADQCTLFYGSGHPTQTISRFNVCTGTSLPNFATVPAGTIEEFHVLPDGGLLVAATNLLRYNAAGTIVRTYPAIFDDSTAFGLMNNGATALVLAHNRVLRTLDIATGAQMELPSLSSINLPTALVPLASWTAAIGQSAHAPSDIPTLSAWAIFFAIAALGLLALRRL